MPKHFHHKAKGAGPGTSKSLFGKQQAVSNVNSRSLKIHDDWPPFRKRLGHIICSKKADALVAVATFTNLMVIIWQTDMQNDEDASTPVFIRILAILTLTLFSSESLCRIYVHRLQMVFHPFYALDGIVSAVDLFVAIFLSSSGLVPMLSLLRCWRLCRLFDVLLRMDQFRELYLMLHGFRSACAALIWATTIIGATLVFCAIFAVQIIHPLNQEISDAGLYAGCDRCPRAFSTVWNSMLTFVQQIITGDSWGLVTIPIIEAYPLAAAFFFPVFLVIDLAVMNLVLMVVVDQAEAARERDLKQTLADKESAMIEAKNVLHRVCEQMDEDQNGDLTLQELTDGATQNEEFADILKLMDIGVGELETVFQIMDADESGTVEYSEFCDQLHKMKTDDAHTMLVLLRHQLKIVLADVKKQLEFHKEEVKMHKEEIILLKDDLLGQLIEQQALMKKIVMLFEGKDQDARKQNTTAGLGVPEAKSPENLATDPSPILSHVNDTVESHIRESRNADCMALALNQLKDWLSKELTPILQDSIMPVLQDVKVSLHAGWGPALGVTSVSGSFPLACRTRVSKDESKDACMLPKAPVASDAEETLSEGKRADMPTAEAPPKSETAEMHVAQCEGRELLEVHADSSTQLPGVENRSTYMPSSRGPLEMEREMHLASNEQNELGRAALDCDDQVSTAESYFSTNSDT